jgi:hypothetical protein
MLSIDQARTGQPAILLDGASALALARERFPNLSGDGVRVYPGSAPQEIHANQVETAMQFLKLLRPTKRPTIGSGTLKHNCEDWGGANGLCAYVSRGALTVAALALNYPVRAYRHGGNVAIGVSVRDLRRVNDERLTARIERRGRIAEQAPL